MTSARDHVLGTIRRRLGRGAVGAATAAALRNGLRRPERGPIPARAVLPHDQQVALLLEMLAEQASTVVRVADRTAVPAAVAAYLAEHDLGRRVRLAPAVADLDWSGLAASAGPAGADDPVSVTPAFAAVAETGTLILLSGADSPTTLNFLPDTHIVVVAVADVVGVYEDVWDRLRAAGPDLPRTVDMITGPSRTGDIEQTIQLGAHGPRRVHIILVGG